MPNSRRQTVAEKAPRRCASYTLCRKGIKYMIKKIWSDPVWSKVIAAGILTAVATAGSYFLNWWPSIGAAIKKCYEFFLLTTNVENWLLALICLLCLPTLIFLFAFIWNAVRGQETSTGPNWRTYTTDLYFGLRWRWKYFDDGGIYDVHTFCPHCDFQVFPKNASAYRIIDRIGFHCDSCNRILGEMDESWDSLENKVKRFIQQKLRNGSWTQQNMA